MAVNFITTVLAFDAWLETNHLSTKSQLLWYKLFMLWNKSGFREWITVDNQRLMSAMQMSSKETFIKTRDNLITAGLINYVKGKKNCPGKYQICSSIFEPYIAPKTVPYIVPNTEPNIEPNTGHIYKQDKTKLYNARGSKKNAFKNFHQRDTDIESIESALITNKC